MNNLAKSILYTITWFDIFDYPLIPDEIYWWLYSPSYQKENIHLSKEDEQENLSRHCGINFSAHPLFLAGDSPNAKKQTIANTIRDELSSTIQEKGNYYFLKRRQETILSRQQRYKYSKKKMKRVKRLQQFLKYFPFIKMVCLCDFMGYMNARQDSDIDLFIITKKNRLWSARIWLTGILKVLNLRPKLKQGIKKDKFCLSFWVTEDNMDLEKVALNFNEAQGEKSVPKPKLRFRETFFSLGDIYFHYWLAGLKPIYDTHDYFQKFLQNNQWVKKYLPHLSEYYQNLDPLTPQPPNPPIFTKFFQKLQPRFLEKVYRWFQLKWMPQELKDLSKDQVGVIIRDNLLKFHWVDKRTEFRHKFLDKLKIENI